MFEQEKTRKGPHVIAWTGVLPGTGRYCLAVSAVLSTILVMRSVPHQTVRPASQFPTLIETEKPNRGSEEKSRTGSYYVPGVMQSVLHMFETLNVRFMHLLNQQLFHLPGEGV